MVRPTNGRLIVVLIKGKIVRLMIKYTYYECNILTLQTCSRPFIQPINISQRMLRNVVRNKERFLNRCSLKLTITNVLVDHTATLTLKPS